MLLALTMEVYGESIQQLPHGLPLQMHFCWFYNLRYKPGWFFCGNRRATDAKSLTINVPLNQKSSTLLETQAVSEITTISLYSELFNGRVILSHSFAQIHCGHYRVHSLSRIMHLISKSTTSVHSMAGRQRTLMNSYRITRKLNCPTQSFSFKRLY